MASDAGLRTALDHGRYALIGAGQLGAMALAMWPAGLPRPEFVLDSARTGTLDGVAIRSLPDHRGDPDVTYLLSVFKMPSREVKAIFARLGQRDILTVYDLFEHFTPSVFTNGWRNLSPAPAVCDALARLPARYADAASRAAVAAASAWRYRRDLVDDYPVGREDSKYDLGLFGRGGCHYDIIYDGGAYDLGLLQSLGKAGVRWGRVVAFEPDPATLALCVTGARACGEAGGAPVTIDRRALSDAAGPARFLANGLLSSRCITDDALAHDDIIAVETCRLDDVDAALTDGDANRRVLVKLHVEGSELAALRGAAGMLARDRVDLLVNLSHDERSYLDIPDYLAGFGRFDLFLRSHALFGEGLTLFARNRA